MTYYNLEAYRHIENLRESLQFLSSWTKDSCCTKAIKFHCNKIIYQSDLTDWDPSSQLIKACMIEIMNIIGIEKENL